MGIGAKRSKKSKSKRQTLKQKYKVLRKVKEHHRKKRKEAKKLGIKPKEPKDPGIPKAWPFKEELISQLKAQKERALLKERQLRDQRRAAAAAAMDTEGGEGGAEGQQQLEAMRAAAAARGREYDRSAAAPGGPGGFEDYSRRAFYKEFVKVVEASEVIIEVLDARDPLGCRCLDVERFVRRLDPSKKIVLLLNKIDLVPREVVEQWLKYFREELPTVAFKCSTQKQAANLGRRQLSQAAEAGLKGSECLGADALLHLLKNYARSADLKTAITVGVVGLPNVGKSSLINSLKRTRVAQVGNTPGVTRAVQEVHLDKHVTLLDSPGVVFADSSADGAAAAALRNCIKVEQLEDPALPVAEIVRRCPARQLVGLYKVPAFHDTEGFLQHVAQARGKLKKGGTVDIAAAARIVLQDWNDGRIPYYTLPPKRHSEVAGSAAVVQQWGADFNADEAFQAEQSAVIAGLPSLEDPAAAFFQTQTVGEARVDLGGLGMEEAEAGQEGSDGMEADDVSEGVSSESEEEGEEGGPSDSGSEGMDEGEAVAPARGTAARKQNQQLYAAAGQYNPHAARAQKTRQKKQQRGPAAADGGGGGMDGGSGSDYDFDADYDVADANRFAQIAADDDE